MKTFNVVSEGKVIAKYTQDEKKSLVELYKRAAWARKNARLVNIICK